MSTVDPESSCPHNEFAAGSEAGGVHELMRSRKGHSNNGQSSERTERGERTENVGSKISNIASVVEGAVEVA